MTDKTYTFPDNADPNFFRDVLIGLFAPSGYDNPEGRKTLRDEFDKALEELKRTITDGKSSEASPQQGD